MKKFAWLVSFIVVLSIVLTACGGGAANTTTEKFRVAIVMPSSINDLAFSQSMYDALMKIQEKIKKEPVLQDLVAVKPVVAGK